MRKTKIKYILLGMLIASALLFLLGSFSSNRINQTVVIMNNSMTIMDDILEFSQVTNDYKNDIVSNEYANVLLERKLNHMKTVHHSSLKPFSNSSNIDKIVEYQKALEEVILVLDEIRIQVENDEPEKIDPIIKRMEEPLNDYQLAMKQFMKIRWIVFGL